MRNRQGFTLLELLIVVIIIAILVAVALPLYGRAVEKGRLTEAITNLGALRQAEIRYYTQWNRITSDTDDLDWTAPISAGGAFTLYYETYGISDSASLSALSYTCVRRIDPPVPLGVDAQYTVTMSGNGDITAPF